MERDELKKILYIHKPIAKFQYIRKGHAFYKSIINDIEILFDVPVIDMGDADFLDEMEGKLLIRWII